MSKNIYRVNSRIKLDEIIEMNYWKPICIVFTKISIMGKEKYEIVEKDLMKVAKSCPYIMVLLIDFDNFIDYNDFFKDIKESTPYFFTLFRNKPIKTINGLEDASFLVNIISEIDEIHGAYVGEIMKHFTQNDKPSAPETTHEEQIIPSAQKQYVPDEETDLATTQSMVEKNNAITKLMEELEKA